MKLLAYMKAHDLNDEKFAEQCGGRVTALAVRKWKYGETNPRIPELVRIAEVTEGDVTAVDFLPRDEDRSGYRPSQGAA